mgnify:CR=1 FL=1
MKKWNNLKILNKDYIWLKEQVKKFNFTPEEALIVTIDGKGQIFCQKKDNKGKNNKNYIFAQYKKSNNKKW